MAGIDWWVLIQIVILLLVLLFGLELILRKAGVRPDKEKRTKSKIVPEGKFYKAHDVLGFVNQEGKFDLNINNGDFLFSARHDKNGHRITKELNSGDLTRDRSKRIWIFGCSFIYGWLVEDQETFPWLLQNELKDWEVTNFAVSGYSTLQSMLQYREALSKEKAPEIVMVYYGSRLHDPRNVFTRSRKKAFTRLDRISPFKVPCGRLNEQDELSIQYDRIAYTGLPLRSYSAFVNYMDNKLNRYFDDKLKEFEVSKKILHEFHRLCQENNSTFIVGGIVQGTNTRKMLDYCSSQGMHTVDIALDRRPEHVHDYDFHPSPLSHQKYANQLMAYLKENEIITT